VDLLSLPEGDDKVAKYPTLFQPADLILLNKIDLSEVLDFDLQRVRQDLARINTRALFLEISSRTGQGLEAFCQWLRERRQMVLTR
jgi:hydrogenase nickel incorporation protein HypB